MSNFVARIAEAAARFPDRPAIEVLRAEDLDVTTYADLMMEARRFAGWFLESGGTDGGRAAILADNDGRWIAAYLGVLQAGGVVVPLDTAYTSGQVATIVQNSGATILFTTLRYLDTAEAAAGRLGGGAPRLALLAGSAPGLPGPEQIDATAPVETVADKVPSDAAVILYTSGTTADPKGVVLTHGNLDAERAAALSVVDVGAQDAVLGVLPLFHALAQMANLLLPLTTGARVVFLETVSSTSLLAALQSRPISIFACVPQFFYLIHERVSAEVSRGGMAARGLFRTLLTANGWLRDHLGLNPGRLVFRRIHRVLGPDMRTLVTGGSRFDPAIGRDLYGMGFTLLNAYGLTETSGGATVMRAGDRFTSSVGQPLPGVEIRIGPRESEGDDAGEVLIRGPIVMREYFNRPDATADTLQDGWLYTGDLGRLDAKGRLYITGRKKEIIVLASGKNLYPEEIESHYQQAPIVKELCVLGRSRPGEPAAERLHAIIVPDEQVMRERGLVNLRERLRFELESHAVQLPAHKRILSYDISLEPLPRTTTGKLRRHQIARELDAETAAEPDQRAERPLSADERTWLEEPRHAAGLASVAARLERETLTPDANLDLDLGLDSMERVELLTWLERGAGTRVSAASRATIFTVRQLVDAVLAAPTSDSGSSVQASSTTAAEDSDATWDAVLAEPAPAELVASLSQSKTIRAGVLFVVIQTIALAARVVPGFRIEGRRHLPTAGPFIVCPNHQSYLDGLFVLAALPFQTFRQIFFVGAAEYFESPLAAWLARAVNIVPVDPDANLESAMRAGAAGLRLKKVLVLFPEGERSIDGELKPFRKGAPILSSHLDAPMVPVALDGLYDLWPRGRGFNWRALWGAGVRLEIGEPQRAARGQYAAGSNTLRESVRMMFAGMRAR